MSEQVISENAVFMDYLDGWMSAMPEMAFEQAFPVIDQAALVSVDIIKGFCTIGPLASPRVNSVVPAIVALMRRAWDAGLRNIILSQDTHEPDAVEFGAWPPHCVRGTEEAESVEEFKALPFYNQMTIIEKNSISTGLDAHLIAWLENHPDVNTFVVVGDCTDLCIYQTAMFLRLDANAHQLERRVIVPVDCVQTYDRPVEVARAEGGLPHPGDFLHKVFLYHMALNGIEVTSRIR